MALTQYFPMVFKQYHLVDQRIAGVLTASYSISASVIRLFGGCLSDKYGGDKVTIFGMISIGVGAFLMALCPPVTPSSPFNIIGMFLMALGGGMANAGIFWWVPKVCPQAVGALGGLVSGVGATGGFFIPLILGAIANTKGKTRTELQANAAMGILPTRRFAYGFFLFTFFTVIAIITEVILMKRMKARKVIEDKKKASDAIAANEAKEKAEKEEAERVANSKADTVADKNANYGINDNDFANHQKNKVGDSFDEEASVPVEDVNEKPTHNVGLSR